MVLLPHGISVVWIVISAPGRIFPLGPLWADGTRIVAERLGPIPAHPNHRVVGHSLAVTAEDREPTLVVFDLAV